MISQHLSVKTDKVILKLKTTEITSGVKKHTHTKTLHSCTSTVPVEKYAALPEKVSGDINVNKQMYCSWDSQACPGWADRQTESLVVAHT